MRRLLLNAAVVCVFGTLRPCMAQPAKAFPDAAGWAAVTPGGRGGKIIRVTTLSSSGPGSLAEALSAKGSRIVVFEVGGVIDLGKKSLRIDEPFVTVAGQTAPEPGVTLIRGGIGVQTHDVVIRHVRIRPGEAGAAKNSGWEVDGLSTNGAWNVMVDHCSFSWSTDENLSASGPRFEGDGADAWRKNTSHRITFSNCIIAEGLSNSTHGKGEHSKGSLIHDNAADIAIIGNLFAHNVQRNPLFKGGVRGIVVNNLIYNPEDKAVHYHLSAEEWGSHPWESGQMVLVGNVLRHGQATRPGLPLLTYDGEGLLEVFLEDNLVLDRNNRKLQTVGVSPGVKRGEIRILGRRPFWPEGLAVLPAGEIEASVLENAGARPWNRDAVDLRIIQEVRKKGGRIVNSEQEAGGYPSFPPTRAPFHPEEWDLETLERSPARSKK